MRRKKFLEPYQLISRPVHVMADRQCILGTYMCPEHGIEIITETTWARTWGQGKDQRKTYVGEYRLPNGEHCEHQYVEHNPLERNLDESSSRGND